MRGLLLLLVAGVLGAQEPAATGSVSGTVLCSDTEGPARRASVYLQPAEPPRPGEFPMPGEVFHATTDLDGAFAMSGVKPGEYYVIAQYEGYISAREYVFPGALSPEINGRRDPPPSFVQRIQVAPGGAVKVAIRLQRGGSISGRVTYGDGAPVAHAGLTAKRKLSSGEFTHVLAGGAVQSDAEGKYRIEGLPAGAYVVQCGMLGEMVPVFGGARRGGNSVMVFAGDGMRPSKARLAMVEGTGEQSGVDVTIPLDARRVRGSVVAPDGHRLNDGLVRLYPTGEPRFSAGTPIDANGYFEFIGIPPDSYTLTVENAGDLGPVPRRYRAGTVEVRVGDADVANVRIEATPIR